ncbi:MAG: response regulator [Hyphomicrobiales bacterium]|jgi:two-component system, chemotaxis family, chemotaxis protein CheY|nr:response regulator [Hyphomicrobiales bacterium]
MRVDCTKLRFLIIDDSQFMRKVLKALLHGFGAREVLEAEDGATGLEAFMTHAPDIVILDWEMPILDGLEVTRMIRQPTTSVNPFAPIIVVTGHSEKRRVTMAREAGVNEFLVKPISSKGLYDRILTVVAFPRPFIRTKNFFGPDRRRGSISNYAGPERRKGGEAEVIKTRPLIEKTKRT